MKKISLILFTLCFVGCSSSQQVTEQVHRTPSGALDLSGTYLGEGLFSKRPVLGGGLQNPAMRLYLDKADGEADTYYGALIEYDQLLLMALPYLASQKAPVLNRAVGYLKHITTRISAYKFVPGRELGTYEMHNLTVQNGHIVPDTNAQMTLKLSRESDDSNPLSGAEIVGNSEGRILFPNSEQEKNTGIADALTLSQYELAKIIYQKAHLASTWRGNWSELEGSYLSAYGRVKDGVLELSSQGRLRRAKFIKTNITKPQAFTNPKSAFLEGDYTVSEPIPKMYILSPTNRIRTRSDHELRGRIGLFLDVFDASAPEAGSHLVTELAFTNPQDPEDFMMYYERADHAKNVGVEPAKAK